MIVTRPPASLRVKRSTCRAGGEAGRAGPGGRGERLGSTSSLHSYSPLYLSSAGPIQTPLKQCSLANFSHSHSKKAHLVPSASLQLRFMVLTSGSAQRDASRTSIRACGSFFLSSPLCNCLKQLLLGWILCNVTIILPSAPHILKEEVCSSLLEPFLTYNRSVHVRIKE